MNNVFAYCSEEKEIHPLRVKEIAKAQRLDKKVGNELSPSLSSTMQLVGITTIYNTLEIHA